MEGGYWSDTLNVYGSLDGETWTLVQSVEVDKLGGYYKVDFGVEKYKYFKLDVEGTYEIRIYSLVVEYSEEKEYE